MTFKNGGHCVRALRCHQGSRVLGIGLYIVIRPYQSVYTAPQSQKGSICLPVG